MSHICNTYGASPIPKTTPRSLRQRRRRKMMEYSGPLSRTQALDGRENDKESVPLFSYQRLILGWLRLRKAIFSFLRSTSHHLLSRKIWAAVTATKSTKTFLWKLERKTLYFSFNCHFIPSAVQCVLQSAPHMAIKPHNIPCLRKGCHTSCLDREMEIHSSKHLASHPTVSMWHRQKRNPGILAL